MVLSNVSEMLLDKVEERRIKKSILYIFYLHCKYIYICIGHFFDKLIQNLILY